MTHPGATSTDKHKVVIIGSGFGGLKAAKSLKRADVDIKMIAKTTHHLFQIGTAILPHSAPAGIGIDSPPPPDGRHAPHATGCPIWGSASTAVPPTTVLHPALASSAATAGSTTAVRTARGRQDETGYSVMANMLPWTADSPGRSS